MIDRSAGPSESMTSADLAAPQPPLLTSQFDLAVLESVMGVTQHRFDLRFVPTIDSTMNLRSYCERADIPIRTGLVLIAGNQTHGVGRTGSWESSAASKDVTMSVVLPDPLSPRSHLLLHIASTLAVARALESATELEPSDSPERPTFRIKLPNDVRVDYGAHFGKICGSLGVGSLNADIKAEHAARGWSYPDNHMVMGIGINLSNDILARSTSLRFPPSSLEYVTGRLFTRELIVGLTLHELDKHLTLAERAPEELLARAWERLAVGAGGAAVLETRSGFLDTVKLLELKLSGLSFLSGGIQQTVPLAEVLRLYPEEPENTPPASE